MSASYHIEQLNKSNYDTWCIQAQAVLIKNNLWSHVAGELSPPGNVDEKKNYDDKELMARSELILLISPSELRQVRGCKTAKEIWMILKNAYESKGPARKATLLKRLILKRMMETDDIRDHLNDVFEIVHKLQNMEVLINQELLSIMLLYSLPASFENFRIAIESRDKLPTPDELKIKIIEESEARRKGPTEKFQENEAYYSKKKKTLICNICNKKGHIAKNCWNNKSFKNKVPSNKQKNFNVCNSASLQESNLWCLDSGCTSHMSGQKEIFTEIDHEKGSLKLASDQYVANIEGSGKIELKEHNLTLNKALYVPKLSTNLMSVACITAKNNSVLFTKNRAYIKDKHMNTVLRAEKINGLYYVRSSHEQANHVKQNDIISWHKKLAHINEYDLKSMLKNNLVRNMIFNENETIKNCETCIKGKMSSLPFSEQSNKRKSDILEIIHSDVCGPMRYETIGGSRYFITFIDDSSKYCFIYFMKTKSEALTKFIEFKNEVENISNKRIKYLQSDNGTEYVNAEFNNYLNKHGIRRRLTAPYTPQQNGVAERKNRSLLEKARCMIIEANIPEKLWAEAIHTANYIINRCPAKSLEGETPYMKWVGRTPSVKHLHVFGSKTFVLHKKGKQGKFQPKASEGVFIGYAQYRKAYRIYLPNKNTVIVSRDVKILDEKMYYEERNNGELKDILFEKEHKASETEENIIKLQGKTKEIKITNPLQTSSFQDFQVDDDEIDEMNSFQEYENEVEELQCPQIEINTEKEKSGSEATNENLQSIKNMDSSYDRPKRNVKPPVWSKDYEIEEDSNYVCESDLDMNSNEWHDAIKSEIRAHIKNDTWKIIKKENHENIVDYKLLLKDKGNIKKARLVARGFSQRPGIDFNETWAPVAKLSSIRMQIATAVNENMKLYHLDVTTAYLNGELDEKIIMKKPEFLEKYIREIMIEESSKEDLNLFLKTKKMLEDIKNVKEEKVCELKKALYGLKQSGRQWHKKLDSELKSIGFVPSEADHCIYTLKKKEEKIIIGLYVDDLLITYTCKRMLEEIKARLINKFEMKDLGICKEFIGIEIDQKQERIKIKQEKYINKLLTKYNMEECKPVNTPIEPYLKLEKKEKCEENFPYQNLIGGLMFLAVATRPDIMYAVSYLSQFNNCYGYEHFKSAKRILRYLKGTKNIGLEYIKNNSELHGYADADWGSCKIDRRSYTGYCFKKANAVVSWESRKQRSTALSTAEAEYMALSDATKEALHLRTLTNDISSSSQNEVVIFSDNQAALKISKNAIISSKTKHIDLRLHFLKEHIEKGTIDVKYIETHAMEADILTKGLPGPRFIEMRTYLGLV